jgi:two-component system, LytTR family, sensor kinase
MSSLRLTKKEKWQLTGSLIFIYLPVMLYLDFPVYSPNLTYTREIFYYQLACSIIVITLFYLWINISEWVLSKLSEKVGEEFLFEFTLMGMMSLLVLGTTLALGYIVASGQLLMVINTTFHNLSGENLVLPFPTDRTTEFFHLYKRANIGFILLLMLAGFYRLANQRATNRIKETSLRAETLEKEKAQAQFAALKEQVSPHFLFNGLSILVTLVRENPVLAEKFIHELSNTYRYILEQKKFNTVQLEKELSFITSYIFLLKIRFDNKFNVTVNLNGHSGQQLIAPMTLQLLVENAVRHNQMSDENPLAIEIKTEADYLVVSNNVLPRISKVESTGIGLQNIVSRYSLLTPQPVIVIEDSKEFTVKLPLLERSS